MSAQDLYGFAFAVGNADPPFGLFTMYPQQEISLQNTSLKDVGLGTSTCLIIEADAVNFDPLIVFNDLVDREVSCLIRQFAIEVCIFK